MAPPSEALRALPAPEICAVFICKASFSSENYPAFMGAELLYILADAVRFYKALSQWVRKETGGS